MLDDAGFCRWLEGLAKAGHEVVIHGYYHQRSQQAGETAFASVGSPSVYTMGEGEFYDLSYDEAACQLAGARAKGGFCQASTCLCRVGFIAPAWLLGPAARRSVPCTKRVSAYTTLSDRNVFHLLRRPTTAGRTFYARSHSFTVAAVDGGACAASLWNAIPAIPFAPERIAGLLRLGLHPPDFQTSRSIWKTDPPRSVHEEASCREGDDLRGILQFTPGTSLVRLMPDDPVPDNSLRMKADLHLHSRFSDAFG